MKNLVKNYFKTVLIVFVIIYAVYLIFEFMMPTGQTHFILSVIKALFLAMLLPLFSKKYLAHFASAENLSTFQKTRNKLFILIGVLVALSIIAILMIYVFVNQAVYNSL